MSEDQIAWQQMFERGDLLSARTDGMHQPARCNYCRRVYDLGTVTVTARYTDCSIWKAPCCGRLVDDRGETGWKSFADYERLERR